MYLSKKEKLLGAVFAIIAAVCFIITFLDFKEEEMREVQRVSVESAVYYSGSSARMSTSSSVLIKISPGLQYKL